MAHHKARLPRSLFFRSSYGALKCQERLAAFSLRYPSLGHQAMTGLRHFQTLIATEDPAVRRCGWKYLRFWLLRRIDWIPNRAH
jgi:hypothetical protein